MTPLARILLVRLSALGDVLLATPAARALHERFPGAEIDWLVEAPYAPLVEASPRARLVAYEKRGRHAGVLGFLRLRRELKARGYDLVVDLQGKPKTRLLAGVAPRRLGIVKRNAAQAILSLVGRERPRSDRHAVDLYLDALLPLGVEPKARELELTLTDAMRKEGEAAVPRLGALGLAPGARWATKRWPAERFAAVARGLAAKGLDVALVGGPSDKAEIAALRESLPSSLAAAPDTLSLSVGGLAAAIARCRLLVACDTGPGHIAAAVGTPVVSIFGPTSPERWRPLARDAEVVRLPLACSPCSNHGTARCPLGHHDCMQRLEPAAVLEAAQRLLARDPDAPAH